MMNDELCKYHDEVLRLNYDPNILPSFVYTTSTLWNSLPPNLQCTNTKYELKKGVKAWLNSKYEHSYFNPFVYF